MKRKWNWPIWIGFVVAVASVFNYEFFAQFPITNRHHCSKMGFRYPFLSDTKVEVIRRHDALHPGVEPKGADIARGPNS